MLKEKKVKKKRLGVRAKSPRRDAWRLIPDACTSYRMSVFIVNNFLVCKNRQLIWRVRFSRFFIYNLKLFEAEKEAKILKKQDYEK